MVTSARHPALLRASALHIEAVPAEEIEENLTVQPGNLSALLAELPGIHLQSTAAALGGAGLQLRGMPARNTLVLMDGLPLMGGLPDSFSLLQAPPLDLAQVEVLKGAASALYGNAATAGVVNLISKNANGESAMVGDVTSLGGQDLLAFLTHRSSPRWSQTLSAALSHQTRRDLDGDGWAERAGYRRISVRPRFWWDGDERRSLMLTTGLMAEDRRGGSLSGILASTGAAFEEALRTRHADAGLIARGSLAGHLASVTRLSWSTTHDERQFGDRLSTANRNTAYGEETVGGELRGHQWLLGAAYSHDALSSPESPAVNYRHDTTAVLAQDERQVLPSLRLAANLRLDDARRFGLLFSSLISVLYAAPIAPFSVRASIANGFSLPNPFIEEVEATSLANLRATPRLRPEHVISAALDGHWAARPWELNLSVFSSRTRNAFDVTTPAPDDLQIVNAQGLRRVTGGEFLAAYTAGVTHLIASWTSLRATEQSANGLRHPSPLIPSNSGEFAILLESEARGRIGVELSYTGRQSIVESGTARSTHAYLELNALAELRFGDVAIFINGINLTNFRQRNYEPLLRAAPGPGGDPMAAQWGPGVGRSFNLGFRAEL